MVDDSLKQFRHKGHRGDFVVSFVFLVVQRYCQIFSPKADELSDYVNVSNTSVFTTNDRFLQGRSLFFLKKRNPVSESPRKETGFLW